MTDPNPAPPVSLHQNFVAATEPPTGVPEPFLAHEAEMIVAIFEAGNLELDADGHYKKWGLWDNEGALHLYEDEADTGIVFSRLKRADQPEPVYRIAAPERGINLSSFGDVVRRLSGYTATHIAMGAKPGIFWDARPDPKGFDTF